MTANTKYSLQIMLGAFLILFIISFWMQNNRKEVGREITLYPGYAIGVLDYKIKGGATFGPSTTDVFILFKVDTKIWRTTTKGKLAGYKQALEGDEYLVIYDTLNPENCQILFDYPIKDSSDFIRYLEEFKTKPLDISKYF